MNELCRKMETVLEQILPFTNVEATAEDNQLVIVPVKQNENNNNASNKEEKSAAHEKLLKHLGVYHLLTMILAMNSFDYLLI